MSVSVPVLSLVQYLSGAAPERAQFGAELAQGLRRFGFVVLENHSIPPAVLTAAYDLAVRLFALPAATKQAYAGGLRGYTPFGIEHAKDHHYPDLKEFWQIGRAEDHPPNIWPQRELQQFRQVFEQLYQSLDGIGATLLEALAPSLQLAPGWFSARVRNGSSILRIIHYPPVPGDADPHCVRSAAHEDINFLTIMVAARGAGLELKQSDGSWLPVEANAAQLIVNTGDMLARLTNEVIPAKTHRVVNPAGANISRYSMPFFMHPDAATSLACLPACVGSGARYPAITAGEFLAQRLREIGLA
jgi:isopenicillin N synthase-like dioxygenase